MENTRVGPFLILKKLGTNRRHKVYHARQVEQQKDVALKFIKVPPNIEWARALEKLNREFDQLQKLRHPHLVSVFGAGVDGKKVFFATELVHGESLAAILGRRGKLAPDQVVEYGRQIAEFLEFLHAKDLIHSKLTPEKVLITPEHQVKISDLRLNRAKRRRWDSTKRRELDIAAYMAPEQFTEGATQKSDFYALGVILYEMLTGKLPYPPDTMGRMNHNKKNTPVPSVATHVMNCPIWLDKIVTQMLDPDPRKRPHSAKAIVMAFEEIRKIDATQQAAVSQMASGFNPLTAGQDKSEAKKLLGHKPPRPKSQTPFFQRIWFQAAALVAVIAMITIAVMLKNDRAAVDQARSLVMSENQADWSRARELLGPVMDGEGELANEAEELYFQSRQKTLVARAAAGQISRVEDQPSQDFGKAYNLEQEGKEEDAADIYARLVDELDPEGDHRHIFRESRARYENLKEQFAWPEDPEELIQLVDAMAVDGTEAELRSLQQKLGQLTIEIAGEPEYRQVSRRVEEKLKLAKQRLIELNEDSKSDSNDPDTTGQALEKHP